jgi:hypothetical protein
MPRINTTVGEHYTGMGDMISLAWIAEGTRDTRDPITFYATRGNHTTLSLLGQDVTDRPDGTGVVVSTAYLTELKEGGARLRLDYVRELLRISTPYKRPLVRIPPDALAWATDTKTQLGGTDLVLLFPQTLWESRAWPACYWVELAWRLKERNVTAAVMLANEDKRFTNTPHFLWGFDLAKVAALMSVATLIVGNDSGPAHLSGTMGVPTIVTSGPTRSACVFGHIPEVISLTNDEPPLCAGCHFKPPFRAACDQGCQALYALKPHAVLGRVIAELAMINSRPPSIPIGLAAVS